MEYDLKTIAKGNLPTTCEGGGGGPNDKGGEIVPTAVGGDGTVPQPGTCGGSTARSGDPFNPNFPGNSGTVTGADPVTIPEPSNLLSLLALGGGIGGGSMLRRYRRKNGSVANKNSNS